MTNLSLFNLVYGVPFSINIDWGLHPFHTHSSLPRKMWSNYSCKYSIPLLLFYSSRHPEICVLIFVWFLYYFTFSLILLIYFFHFAFLIFILYVLYSTLVLAIFLLLFCFRLHSLGHRLWDRDLYTEVHWRAPLESTIVTT